MLAYLVRRIAWAGVLFLAITMVTFILFFVLPVSDARFVRRTEFGSNDFKRALAIHGPIYQQYGQFLGRCARARRRTPGARPSPRVRTRPRGYRPRQAPST